MTRLLRGLAALAAIVATVAATVVTHTPGPRAFSDEADRAAVRGAWEGARDAARRLPDLPSWLDPLISDKTIHLVVFGVPALFWTLSLGRRLPSRVGWLLAVLGAWATLDEGSQALLGRDGEWFDWVANLVGVAGGVGLGWGVVALVGRARPVSSAR